MASVRIRWLAGLFSGLLSSGILWALPAGGLVGRVADDSGAGLPGVVVEAGGSELPLARVTTTDRDGRYSLDMLTAGSYQVSFRLLNFVGVVERGVAIEAGQTARLDAMLHLSVAADVVVTGKSSFRNLAEIADPGQSLVGVAVAASQGATTARQLETRTIQRAGDLLEAVPGVVTSQHSGEGKANQYYLRGFNLDHGTDISTSVAGMPVNMPTHGHGHGWTDLNFLIPELVSGIQYRKGPYYAEDGDFSTAAAVNIHYVNTLERSITRVSGGERQYGRALFAASPRWGGGNLLYAIELSQNNGPWVNPDRYRKYNGVLRYSQGDSQSGFSVTGMGYQAKWNATDQVADRAVTGGLISRFGAIDPTDGGEAHRYSLSGEWQRSAEASVTRATLFGIDSRLSLISNFTYFLNDPVNGDQFEQVDRRRVYGFKGTHRWLSNWFGRHAESLVGVSARFDDIRRVGLYSTAARRRLSTTREDDVFQSSGGVFAQSEVQWAPRLRTIVGLRGDLYRFDVSSDDRENSGQEWDDIFSPKLSVILGPWRETELYVNAGYGFHSNDARGATITRDPKTGAPAERVTPLVRARGAEFGVRSIPVPRWQSTLALWGLDIDSELIFVGDAGGTEAGRPSRRAGIEWSNYYRLFSWLTLEADAALSHVRFRDSDPAGDRIPGSVEQVYTAGASVEDLGKFSGGLHLRHFGPRPLVEDGSVRSKPSTLLNAQVGYEILRGLKLSVDVFNLLDAKVSDIDYFYTSRLPGEPPEGRDDIHTHPVEPRTARLSVLYAF